MDCFRILSLNCRGLGDVTKRKDVFNYLRKKQFSVYCLQDTHFTSNDLNYIRSQWGYDVYLSPGTRDSRGVAILFNPIFEYNVINQKIDNIGNMIWLELEVEKKFTLNLINIYGPNQDSPVFYSTLSEALNQSNNDFTILCGDFNLVQDASLDYYNYKAINNPKAREELLNLKLVHNLQDPWRICYPNLTRYTWFKKNPVKKGRLDFFLVSEELLSLVNKIEMKPGYRTDHSTVEIEFKITKFDRGRGFWKFNNALLRDKEYVDKVKETIKSIVERYALPVYNLENIHNIPLQDLQFSINDQLFFDQILMEIRGMTIPYATKRKKDKLREEETLMKQISILNIFSQSSPESDIFMELLEEYKNKLENLRKEKLNGLILRSKAKWIELGEKPSKYFCGLEKRNYTNRTVTRIVNNKNETVTDQKMILKEITSFYENLYSSRDDNIENVNLRERITTNVPKLSINDSNMLEGKLSYNELLNAVKQTKNGKSPGTDGFTAEFFKVFWIDIGQLLLRCLNYSFEIGELSISQKQGIISIIPKGDKPRELLKNWRPISLLNVSYKILATCLANRIKKILDNLINENQKGFVPGRYIGENTRLLYDVMSYTEHNNIPGIILLVDFEKAFDSISWKFMHHVLDFFNFGPDFKRWVKVLYTDAKLCVIQNGIFSKFFNIGRGCRQGDPISPYLFILCVEIMGILIRQNQDMKGITIGCKEFKLFQYADDTGIFIDGTERSLRNALDLLDQFSKYSGLLPNIEKTKCIWIGSKRGSKEILCREKKLDWIIEPFSVLGIIFSTKLRDIPDLNFNKKMQDIQSAITQWKKRNLTVLGKITVAKTILLSKITHLLISIPSPSKIVIKKLETLLFKYIWNDKNDRIARGLLVQDYKEGGCRMVHPESYIKALKLSWIRRIFNCDTSWKSLLLFECSTTEQKLYSFGDFYINMLKRRTKNMFWKEVLNVYIELRMGIDTQSFDNVMRMPIWFNSQISIGGSSIFYKKWYDKGIQFICDLFTENGKFCTYIELCNRYNVNILITQYLGIKQAIMLRFPHLVNAVSNIPFPISLLHIEIMIKHNKGIKHLYNAFISKLTYNEKYIQKWESELNLPENTNVKKYVDLVNRFTTDTTLRWFQYRITHRIIATNEYLYKIKVKGNNLCTFCNQDVETIEHLFIGCEKVEILWNNIEQWIYEKCNVMLNFSKHEIIFGKYGKPFIAQNMIVILVKYYIYKNRCRGQQLHFPSIKLDIIHYYKMEKYIYHINRKFKQFYLRWELFKNLFENTDV